MSTSGLLLLRLCFIHVLCLLVGPGYSTPGLFKKAKMESTIQKLVKELKAVGPGVAGTVFFRLLTDGAVSFERLSLAYVQSLEDKKEANSHLIAELGFGLTQYMDGITGGTKEQLKARVSKALIQTNLFKGTPYEQELKHAAGV